MCWHKHLNQEFLVVLKKKKTGEKHQEMIVVRARVMEYFYFFLLFFDFIFYSISKLLLFNGHIINCNNKPFRIQRNYNVSKSEKPQTFQLNMHRVQGSLLFDTKRHISKTVFFLFFSSGFLRYHERNSWQFD